MSQPWKPADVPLDHNYGMIQVVLPPGLQTPLRKWLASNGLGLFPIPYLDDLPTYGVGEGAAVEPEWRCHGCKTAVASWHLGSIPYCAVCGHYMSRVKP
jgi:hypothetical protein